MNKNASKAKKSPKAVAAQEPAKLKKIRTGLKGGRAADPCNNCALT